MRTPSDLPWTPPLYLYHGTTAKAALRAFEVGLQPRRVVKTSNWKTFESHPDFTYLTDAYAPFYASMACDEGESWGVVEVSLVALDFKRLRPEEDALEQITRGVKDWSVVEDPQIRSVLSRIPEGDMVERTRYVRDHADRVRGTWVVTLQHMGTCAYRGPIPARAITRVATYDPESNSYVSLASVDPTITLLNYQLMADHYRALTKWFFEPVEVENFLSAVDKMSLGAMPKPQAEERLAYLRESLAKRGGLEVRSRRSNT